MVPVHQAFRGQIQELQALCLECHRTKTALENSHATTLESRFSRRAYEAYVHSPRLPAGVRPAEVGPRQAVPRHRRGAVPQERAGQRPLPSSRFLSPGHHCGGEAGPCGGSHLRAPAEGQQDGASEQAALYVGEGWYAKPACAYMLESGVATWQDFLWSLDATAHVEPSCLAWALRRMEEAWGEEEHLAKLSVNALIGLWARNVDLLYLMRTSNNQLDGNGCQYRQTFVDSKGGTHWDHVYVAQLFSNASHRVMAAEYCAVASIRQQLAEVPTRYFKCIKTDCLVLQGLPKKYWPAVERLTRGRHPTAPRSTGASRWSRCWESTGSPRWRRGRRCPAAGRGWRTPWPTA